MEWENSMLQLILDIYVPNYIQITPNMHKNHQIMSVHTKWNCLIPILSGLVKY